MTRHRSALALLVCAAVTFLLVLGQHLAHRYAAVRRQAIAEMVDVERRSMSEVAGILGISKAMVQKIVERHRARMAIKE